jgi:hypothetical protein
MLLRIYEFRKIHFKEGVNFLWVCRQLHLCVQRESVSCFNSKVTVLQWSTAL